MKSARNIRSVAIRKKFDVTYCEVNSISKKPKKKWVLIWAVDTLAPIVEARKTAVNYLFVEDCDANRRFRRIRSATIRKAFGEFLCAFEGRSVF